MAINYLDFFTSMGVDVHVINEDGHTFIKGDKKEDRPFPEVDASNLTLTYDYLAGKTTIMNGQADDEIDCPSCDGGWIRAHDGYGNLDWDHCSLCGGSAKIPSNREVVPIKNEYNPKR